MAYSDLSAKQMRVPRGTARRIRREHAWESFRGNGIDQKYFKYYWRLGANVDALEKVLRIQADADARVS